MKKLLKKIFRKPAIVFVTLWANRTYKQGVAAAEQRHWNEGVTIYLAADSWRPDHLVTYNKTQFMIEKRVYGMAARLLTMGTLRNGCYYYTKDKLGTHGMSKHDMELRRKAFIKERLLLAGLIEPSKRRSA